MSVRFRKDNRGTSHIYVDAGWPDGQRFRRIMPTRKIAEVMDARIRCARADGTWRQLRDELARGEAARKVTLNEFSEEYLDYCKIRNRAWQRKRDSMRMLCQRLGTKALEEIHPSDLDRYFQWRLEAGRAKATLNRDLAHLRHLMNFAVRRGVIEKNPIASVEKFKEEIRMRRKPTAEEVDHFLASAEDRIRPLFGFIRETGCRLSEALRVKRHEILREPRLAVFTDETKSGKFRTVSLTVEALHWINEMPGNPTCSYLFWNPKTGTRWYNVRKPINRAIRVSGLDWFLIKDLRRGYGIRLAEGGAEMHVIQAMLGHSSVKTTETYYAHFSPHYAARRALQVLENGKKVDENRTTSAIA